MASGVMCASACATTMGGRPVSDRFICVIDRLPLSLYVLVIFLFNVRHTAVECDVGGDDAA